MKKTFQKTLIAASVGAVMAVASLSAQADSVLFPYYSVGAGKFSFLSLTNKHTASVATHYVWNWKTPAADGTAAISGSCTHEDASGSLTSMDLIQHTVESPTLATGNLTNLQTLFGDTSTPAYSLTAPAVGFLAVHGSTGAEGSLIGQMIVVDVAGGTVAAYRGLQNAASTAEGDFSAAALAKTAFTPTWYPTTETGSKLGAGGIDTTWVAVVLGSGMHLTTWAGAATFTNSDAANNVYDRDEVPRSGALPATVTCFGTMKRSAFMSAAQATHTVNGGVTTLAAGTFTGNATGAILTKVETSLAMGKRITAISEEN